MAILDCLIPVYNNEDYLSECLESILAQTFQDFKVLIYDAASNDGSLEIIKEFQKKDDRIHLISGEKNKGISSSLNKLLKATKAKYVAWQFPDDYSAPMRFEKQIERLKNSSLVCIGSSILWEGTAIEQKVEEVIASVNPKDILLLQIMSDAHRGLFLETAMYERKALKNLSAFDEELSIKYDLEFHADLQLQFPLRIANLKEVLYTMRLFPGCIQQKQHEGDVSVDDKAIATKVGPVLLMTKFRYLDNVLITSGFLPY